MTRKIILIFITALVLRSVMLGAWYQAGKGHHFTGDTPSFYGIAESLAQGKGYQLNGEPTSRRPPVYPMIIAGMLPMALFPLGMHGLQAIAGAASCVFLGLLGARLFDRRVGLLAALFFTFDYMSIRQAASLMPDLLFTFFLLAAVYFLYLGLETRKSFPLIVSGLMAGVTLLTNDSPIYYFFMLGIWILLSRRFWNLTSKKASLFIISLFLVIAPWIVRNMILYDQFVLLTIRSGHSFYFGNNPHVLGRTTGGEWEFGKDVVLPEDAGMPPLLTLEADRYLFRKGIEFIRDNPLTFVQLMGKKIIKMWRPAISDAPVFSRWLMTLGYVPVMIFGLMGIGLLFRSWRKLFPVLFLIAYFFLVHAVTIAGIRYRFPVMPFLMLFAAYAILEGWQKLAESFVSKKPLAVSYD